MRYYIFVEINEGKAAEFTANRNISTDKTFIYLTAGNFSEASAILGDAERIAEDYLSSHEEEEPEQKAAVAPVQLDAESELTEFELTTAGKRFIASLKKAQELIKEHDKNSLTYSQMLYLSNCWKCRDKWEAFCNLYNIGFKKGYEAAYKEGNGERFIMPAVTPETRKHNKIFVSALISPETYAGIQIRTKHQNELSGYYFGFMIEYAYKRERRSSCYLNTPRSKRRS